MHTRTILAPLIPLALAIGATCTPTANTRYAQLRLYGAPGCYAQNMGELGVYDINKCQSLVFEGQEVVRSVLYQTSTDGCSCMLNSILGSKSVLWFAFADWF